jgi:Ca2+-binding RTX toxin-like protein
VPTLPIRSAALRVALVGALATSAFAVLAPAASAAACPFDGGTHHATAFASDTETVLKLRVSGSNLTANGVTCAALTNLDLVTVDMSASSSGRAVFDLSGGAFAPGFTDEGDGSSEIEFTVVGLSSQGSVSIVGSPANDGIAIGQESINNSPVGQIDLNSIADAGTPDVDVTFGVFPVQLQVDTGTGNDTIDGTGVAAQAYSGTLRLTGGPGTNTITGGTGSDEINIRTEVVSTGHETVHSGGGFDRVLISTESPSLLSTFSLDDMANDGVGCPGTFCEGDDIGADIFQITGSPAQETLIGNSSTNAFFGGGGKDVLKGLGGLDNLTCSGGKALGGTADDYIAIDVGCASASGGPGVDAVSFALASGGVKVSLDGVKNDGASKPFANVRSDVENVVGSNFGDTMTGNDKKNLLQGGNGRDNLSGGPADDRLQGGAGNDTLDGGDGVDVCGGGPGMDILANCE